MPYGVLVLLALVVNNLGASFLHEIGDDGIRRCVLVEQLVHGGVNVMLVAKAIVAVFAHECGAVAPFPWVFGIFVTSNLDCETLVLSCFDSVICHNRKI